MPVPIRPIVRIVAAWLALLMTAGIAAVACHIGDDPGDDGEGAPPLAPAPFFRAGPHADLRILTIPVDTPAKYAAVVAYCAINAVVRAAHAHMVTPWVINHVQDETRPPPSSAADTRFAYEATLVSTAYHWADWLLCMAILLAQADLVAVEMAADLASSVVATRVYIEARRAYSHTREPEEPLLPPSRIGM